MAWKDFARARLPEHLDAQGDLAPPWARFPDYEHHTIGWRMGSGETWLTMWAVFLEQLGRDPATRLAYLQRHPPAPFNWAETVHRVLYPALPRDDDDDDDDDDDERAPTKADLRRDALLAQGLIASDVAFPTWLGQQKAVRWPWQEDDTTPESEARYNTRAFWFWSRQIAAPRKAAGWAPPPLPEAWQACSHALEHGAVGAVDARLGLRTLAQMLCAGHVQAPWQLGLSPADFADSFDDDMGYVDAFRLWGMAAFDDEPQIRRYLETAPVPPDWAAWVAEHLSPG